MVQRSVRGTEAGFNHGLSTICFDTDDEPPLRTPPDRSILRGSVGTRNGLESSHVARDFAW